MIPPQVLAILGSKEFIQATANLASQTAKETTEFHRQSNEYFNKRYDALEAERRKIYQDRVDALNKDRERFYELLLRSENQEEKEKYSNLYLETNVKLEFVFEEAEQNVKDCKVENVEIKEKAKSDVPGLAIANFLLPGFGTFGYFKLKNRKEKKAKEIEKK